MPSGQMFLASRGRLQRHKRKPVVNLRVVRPKSRYSQPSRKQITNRIPSGYGNPVADRTFCWLNYSDSIIFGTAVGGVDADYIFNMNSIFDPDRTGVGHQPYGHDTYNTLYQRYRVHKFKWFLTMCANNANTTEVAVAPLNHVTASTTQLLLEESSVAKGSVLFQAGTSTKVFSGMVDLQKLNGASRTEYNSDDRFEANFGASPSELMGLHIVVRNQNGALGSMYCQLKFQFYTEMFDPIPLPQS